MMSEGVNKNRLGIERLVEVCAENNAKRWGLYPRTRAPDDSRRPGLRGRGYAWRT